MKILICFLLFATIIFISEAKQIFDKSQHKYTVWSQANPWFPPNLMPHQRVGGTDYAWHQYSDSPVEMWKKVAQICKPYGLTGIQLEVSFKGNGEIHHAEYLKYVMEGFAQAGNGFKVMPFITTARCPDRKSIIKLWDKYFNEYYKYLKNHPSLYRLNGIPVITLYTQQNYSVEDWIELRKFLNKKYGPVIMLMNTWMPPLRSDKKLLKKYIEIFDGVTAYANFTPEAQASHMQMVAEIMKDFPEKIFEASVHNTYTQHYNYGGIFPELTEKLRKSFDIALNVKPDSLVLTNFFDIYENSRILPSYEYDDFILELTKYKKSQWMDIKYHSSNTYPYYLSNFISLYAGQPLRFELLALPANKAGTVKLELANAAGKRLYISPPVNIPANEFFVYKWELPATSFHEEYEIYPRLIVNDSPYNYSPPTMINPSHRSHLLWYTRSLKNQLKINGNDIEWNFCGGKAGDILDYNEYGIGYFQADFKTSNGGIFRLLRNGAEFARWKRSSGNIAESISLPHPGAGCDAYALELLDHSGKRFRTTSIFISGTRKNAKNITIPIVLNNGKLKNLEFQADRIPFYHYRGNIFCGSLLIDSSGYRHDGFMGGVGYGGGHLLNTGYRHEHFGGLNGTVYPQSPRVMSDKGKTYLQFDGNEYICIQGGTMFPYAMTLEFEILRQTDTSAGVMGCGNKQLQVFLRGDGKLLIYRSEGTSSSEKMLISEDEIPKNNWTHVAIVYDAEKISIYIDGKNSGNLKLKPSRRHETFCAMVVGASCINFNRPGSYFKGGLRNIRLTGRNLQTSEFLK